MKTYHYPPFLLFYLVISTFSALGPDASNSLYNHLQLVYLWPSTFCLDRNMVCKKPVAQNFVLHGLWPADRAGNSLVYCSRTGSISRALTKYERQLAACWPSLSRHTTNRQFWQYQWDKHGTCVLPRMNVLHYLQLMISRQGKFNLLRALTSNNIKPNGSSYPRCIIEAAIRQEIGTRNLHMSCLNFRTRLFIKEVYMHLDVSGHKVVSCPISNKTRGCGRSVNLVFSAAASRV
ncbi:Ribonuclease T(2) [Handroanthus impetiginosus]|uniref:Ribonuclease T(2) n=1 Tax=Handroanthus impetiginosus TaxID=429701 RepID=A0A2G9G7K9_9LAMI|nr:Ribonuclease T(2) [Handroanthus impetiginosus]